MCPISLQIMKDPVTAASGITYDRDSIEKWLSDGRGTMLCPVTKQPLPRGAELTPNHTLHRLIQSWAAAGAAAGVHRIPPPNPPLTKAYAVNLVRALSVPILRLKALRKLDMVAAESERNRKFMAEAGVVKEMLSFVVECYKEGKTAGLEEALRILYLMRNFSGELSQFVSSENDRILDSFLWVLDNYDPAGDIKTHALCVLRTLMAKGDYSAALLERLKPELLKKLVTILRESEKNKMNPQGINAALHVMSAACHWGRNRAAMNESGAVFELIEVEINNSRENKTTELVLGILSHLCCCADGRAQLVGHAAGIAAVSHAILKVSARADDEALRVLSSISRFSATSRVIGEMARVGTVAKLCMVLQANCASSLKDKAREILRTHSDIWKDSPCVEMLATFTVQGVLPPHHHHPFQS
ncbi:PREDICTED: E3 ubiquitin-protein ligase PUB24-like [Ipomoea nil]|uniref:E3 ubiquitin-protein ligase PUB24-like n=1 Tax=Ipomoea nil TaxID=35883 RepID=UPI0009017865|nr:PREDICTED: E3 ubiquitin-protein ligase PUB24-like [Ipomoea nil]